MKYSRVLQGWRSRILLGGVIIAANIFAVLFAVSFPQSANALTTVPTKMNFQGRITDNAGNILANGTYNMRFKIYDAATAGTLQWSEDRLVSASQGVSVTNGQFSVQLGSISSLPESIFTNTGLYFEIELPSPGTATSSSPSWTEGPMTPRNQIATSAYAFNADMIDGIDGASLPQLGIANTFTWANAINTSHANAFQVENGATNLFNVDTSGSIITIGAADTTGALLVLDTKTGAGDPAGTAGAMYYNSNSGTFRCYDTAWRDCDINYQAANNTFTGTNAFNGATLSVGGAANTAKFNVASLFNVDTTNSIVSIGAVDGTATVLVVDTKNTAGDPTGSSATNGAMYYNSSLQEFRCYANGNWGPCHGSVTANTSVPVGNTFTNTAAENIFASNATIPANECRAGKVYRITAVGTYGTQALTAPSLTMRLKFGTTDIIATPANATTASLTGRQWTLNASVICQTAPSTTATVEGQGWITRSTSAVAAVNWEFDSTGSVTVDTTVPQTVQLSAQFGTANAANTITLRQFIMEELVP